MKVIGIIGSPHVGGNGATLVREALARVALDGFFERIFVSSELGVEKPDRRFFAALLDGLGLPPEACVMVGDSYVNDVRGAAACGLRTVWLAPAGAKPTGGVAAHDARVSSLAELPAAIAALEGDH